MYQLSRCKSRSLDTFILWPVWRSSQEEITLWWLPRWGLQRLCWRRIYWSSLWPAPGCKVGRLTCTDLWTPPTPEKYQDTKSKIAKWNEDAAAPSESQKTLFALISVKKTCTMFFFHNPIWAYQRAGRRRNTPGSPFRALKHRHVSSTSTGPPILSPFSNTKPQVMISQNREVEIHEFQILGKKNLLLWCSSCA